jgi:hypothetical protein
VEFFEGLNKIGEATNSPYHLTWNGVLLGSYTLTALATDNDGKTGMSLPLNIVVASNSPPTVSINLPTNDTQFIEGDLVVISVGADDSDGVVRLVEFFADGNNIGERTNSPYTLTWSNAPVGTHILTAVATDDKEAATLSASVSITVASNLPPSVVILEPAEGQGYFAPANILITTAADDSDGTISRVEFLADGIKLGERTNSPYELTWTNVSRGIYLLSAVATDDRGATNISASVSVTVSNGLPIVTLLQPTNNAQFVEGTDVTLEAGALDPDGTIVLVEFFEGTNKLGELTNAPFSLVWSNVALGEYVMTVQATDNDGAIGISSPVTNTVVTNEPPTVSIISPFSGQGFFAPAEVVLSADASDADGTIALLEFFEGTNKLGEVTNAPYEWAWSNVLVGTYTLTGIATDDRGATAVSDPVEITVYPSPPVITLLNPAVAADSFTFSFMTEPEWSYFVQYADSLESLAWLTLTNITGDGTVFSVTDTISTNSQRVYRVIAE